MDGVFPRCRVCRILNFKDSYIPFMRPPWLLRHLLFTKAQIAAAGDV
jgi:hypothetical protein